MARVSGFRLDPDFEASVLRSDAARDALAGPADAVAARAVELAPDDPATVTDDLRSSIGVETELTRDGWRARVRATDYKAGWWEFGNARHSARPYLRPALDGVPGVVPEGGD